MKSVGKSRSQNQSSQNIPMNQPTTAIYSNRVEDKDLLEIKLSLPEFGNEDREFYLPNGTLLAKGYVRVVYGDHGPYIEFDKIHFKLKLLPRFGNKVDLENLPDLDNKFYYYWLFPYGDENTKVYLQIKPVSDLPNAPKRNDGKQSSFNRDEGYADYKRGMYYVDPYSLK